jgi:hypothetical protein
VTWSDWLRLAEAETALGKPQNRPRVKVVTVKDMLSVIHK